MNVFFHLSIKEKDSYFVNGMNKTSKRRSLKSSSISLYMNHLSIQRLPVKKKLVAFLFTNIKIIKAMQRTLIWQHLAKLMLPV